MSLKNIRLNATIESKRELIKRLSEDRDNCKSDMAYEAINQVVKKERSFLNELVNSIQG